MNTTDPRTIKQQKQLKEYPNVEAYNRLDINIHKQDAV